MDSRQIIILFILKSNCGNIKKREWNILTFKEYKYTRQGIRHLIR